MFGTLARNTAPFVFTLQQTPLGPLSIKTLNMFVFYFLRGEPFLNLGKRLTSSYWASIITPDLSTSQIRLIRKAEQCPGNNFPFSNHSNIRADHAGKISINGRYRPTSLKRGERNRPHRRQNFLFMKNLS